MSAILLTLFINPHRSQPTATYTVHFLSEGRGEGGSQVSGRLLLPPPPSSLLLCSFGLKELFCASHGFRSTFPDHTMFRAGWIAEVDLSMYIKI